MTGSWGSAGLLVLLEHNNQGWVIVGSKWMFGA
jgi:hypothetical protein